MQYVFLQSEGSNTGKAFEIGDEHPQYKVLFSEGYGLLGVRGIQSTELINGEPQQPIVVRSFFEGKYQPSELPKTIEESQYWDETCKLLKDMFNNPGLKRDGRIWVLQAPDDKPAKERCKFNNILYRVVCMPILPSTCSNYSVINNLLDSREHAPARTA